MKTVYVAFGSNVGNRRRNVERAIAALVSSEKISVENVSPLYETEAIGPVQRRFFNGVLAIKTVLPPVRLLAFLKATEKQVGRLKTVKWGPRVIDLDILNYGSRVLRTRELSIPHPHYHSRLFVVAPFTDLAERFVHPVLRRSNRALFRELTLSGQRVTMIAQWKKSRFIPFRKKRKKKSPSLH